MQKAFGKKSVIFMFLFPAFLIYTAFVIVSIVWAGYYSFFDWSGVGGVQPDDFRRIHALELHCAQTCGLPVSG